MALHPSIKILFCGGSWKMNQKLEETDNGRDNKL